MNSRTRIETCRRWSGAGLCLLALAVSTVCAGAPLKANRIPEDSLTEEPAPLLEELAALRLEARDAAERLVSNYGRRRFQPLPSPHQLEFLLARAYDGYTPRDSVLAHRLAAGFAADGLESYISVGLPDSLVGPFGATLHPRTLGPPSGNVGTTHLDDEALLLELWALAARSAPSADNAKAAHRTAEDLACWISGPRGGFMEVKTRAPARGSRGPLVTRGPASEWTIARLIGALGLAAAVFDSPDWGSLNSIDSIEKASAPWGNPDDPTQPAFNNLQSGALGYALDAYIDAYVTTGRRSWFESAARAAREGLRQASAGLMLWPTPYTDATGWAALGLARWGMLAHEDTALAVARQLLERMDLKHAPGDSLSGASLASRAATAQALELLTCPAPMAYVVGDSASAEFGRFRVAALRARRPLHLVSAHDRNEPDLLYPAGPAGQTTVYVCSGEICAAPVHSIPEMLALLEAFARPDPPVRPVR